MSCANLYTELSNHPSLSRGGGMFRHRERAARIGWWFDNLFIARRWAVRESMLLSRLRRDCSDTRSASSQCSNERGPLAPLHGAPLNAA